MRAAKALLDDGAMADGWTRQHGEVRTAIPVEFPKHVVHSWFVPVTHGDLLLGFFELTPELFARRYASFQKRDGSLEGCPPVLDWVDHETVRRKAARHVGLNVVMGEPYLSYDNYPSRLAWAVPVRSANGSSRVVFVAGDAVFESRGP